MRLTSLKLHSLEDVFIQELKDLYSAETQLVDALPKMAEKASDPRLSAAFREHLEQTKGHVNRLEQIFDRFDKSPKGEKCEAMEGLISEGESFLKADADAEVRDVALIVAAQKVEHYEIAGYGSARTIAHHLGNEEAAQLLQQTLDEEGETDKKLTQIAESRVNPEAEHVH